MTGLEARAWELGCAARRGNRYDVAEEMRRVAPWDPYAAAFLAGFDQGPG